MAPELATEPDGARLVSQRFYCPDPPSGGRFRLRADEARHLARVSRHGPGDLVEIFDGRGFATLARVVEVRADQVELVPEGVPLEDARPPCRITLATAIPKGDRFDWLVEKATELGAVRLIPLITERSVVDPRGSKLERLRRTIVEACKQSRRSGLMDLDPPRAWPELLRETVSGGGLRLIALQSGLRPGRWPEVAGGSEVLLAVGPEGGFSPAEEQQAISGGWHPARLAAHVLRVETAAIAGVAAILARTREDDGDGLD
jgi:16S rRNA (uracil1498-N3)-methyltransferase